MRRESCLKMHYIAYNVFKTYMRKMNAKTSELKDNRMVN